MLAIDLKCMRQHEERFFQTSDGVRLFYRYWAAETSEAAGAIVLLHRGHEHSGRLAHVAEELDLPDFAIFAWDARGHGHSVDGSNTRVTLGTFVRDLDGFAHHIVGVHGFRTEDIALIGQSVGSVLAATWVHDYAPKIRCMILGSPAFKVKLYVPFARPALAVMNNFVKDLHVNSYVKPSALTHDPERIASYKSDPLIQRPISVRVLTGLYSTADRVIADAQAIQTPTQLLISGKDWVVHHKPQHEFFERLGSAVKEKHVFEGFYHDTLGEKDRALPIAKARAFLLRMFDGECVRSSKLDAHERGYTRKEFDALSQNLYAESELGALLSPQGQSDGFWTFFEFDDIGYIKDAAEEKLDADSMWSEMKENSDEANKARKEQGYPSSQLVAWTVKPNYNAQTQRLEWAYSFRSEGQKKDTVNYNTRLLGRHGVMRVTVVPMGDLDNSLPLFNTTIAGFEFKDGNRYAQFSSGDKLAKAGLAALVVGGVAAAAAKSGLLGKLWKLIVVAFVAVWQFLKKQWDQVTGKKTKVVEEAPIPNIAPQPGAPRSEASPTMPED